MFNISKEMTVTICIATLKIIEDGPGHEKTYLSPYANNKGADQPAQSDHHLCCSLLRSYVYLLYPKFQDSSSFL